MQLDPSLPQRAGKAYAQLVKLVPVAKETTDLGDSARAVDGIGIVTPHGAHAIAAAWEGVLDRRAGLRSLVIAARPRFGRDRMIDEYRTAVSSLLEVAEVAA